MNDAPARVLIRSANGGDPLATKDDLRALTDAMLHPAIAIRPLIDPAGWQRRCASERQWALDEWIPARQAACPTGGGSAGKSLLGQ